MCIGREQGASDLESWDWSREAGETSLSPFPTPFWLLRTSLSQLGAGLRNSCEKSGAGGAAASASRYWSPEHREGAG